MFLGFGSKGHHFNTPYLALLAVTHSIQLSKNKNRPEPHTLQEKLRACQGTFRSARESNRGSSREVSLYSSVSYLVKRRVNRSKVFSDMSNSLSPRRAIDRCGPFCNAIKTAILKIMRDVTVAYKSSGDRGVRSLIVIHRSVHLRPSAMQEYDNS